MTSKRQAGTANVGTMTMNDTLAVLSESFSEDVMRGFATLMEHVVGLYTFGDSCSVSESEGYQIASSVLYVLGLTCEDDAPQVATLLACDNVIEIWTARRAALEARVGAVMQTWHEAVAIMPAVHNIALRDTLASIGGLPANYDTFFSAHEVPCEIDYPLYTAVPESLKGLDYVQAWLDQLLREARFLSLFDAAEMEAYLQSWCPDFRGLLINLYEPIRQAWEQGMLQMKVLCVEK